MGVVVVTSSTISFHRLLQKSSWFSENMVYGVVLIGDSDKRGLKVDTPLENRQTGNFRIFFKKSVFHRTILVVIIVIWDPKLVVSKILSTL